MLVSSLNAFNCVDDCLLIEIGHNGEMVQHFSTQPPGEMLDTAAEVIDWLRANRAHTSRGILVDSAAPGAPDAAALFIAGNCSERTLVLGLYRHANRSAFGDVDRAMVFSLAEMLLALADIHLRLTSRRGVSRQIEHTWKAVLSERERAVATLFARGETARMIADQLGLAQTSVITYKKRAFVKLGVSRQCELTALVGALQ